MWCAIHEYNILIFLILSEMLLTLFVDNLLIKIVRCTDNTAQFTGGCATIALVDVAFWGIITHN